MPESQTAPEGRPQVLLALNTGHRYAMHYFEALIEMGIAPEVTSYTGDEISYMKGRSYEVLVHMGLGEKDERIHGLELVHHANELFPGVPLLVISGHHESYALSEVLRQGAADFLHRPDRASEGGRPSAADIAEFKVRVGRLLSIKGAQLA